MDWLERAEKLARELPPTRRRSGRGALVELIRGLRAELDAVCPWLSGGCAGFRRPTAEHALTFAELNTPASVDAMGSKRLARCLRTELGRRAGTEAARPRRWTVRTRFN